MKESRKKPRGYTNDYFLVFEIDSGELIGRLLNLTTDGLMLISEEEAKVNKTIKCRMILPAIIEGCQEIYFDMQSRWCQKNKRADWYETGYEILNKTKTCKKVLEVLAKDWMNQKDIIRKTI